MKNKKEKKFDAVKMVREIRDAMFKKATDADFDQNEFKRIKAKWTKLLELEQKRTRQEMDYA
jgi:hypothetical protein